MLSNGDLFQDASEGGNSTCNSTQISRQSSFAGTNVSDCVNNNPRRPSSYDMSSSSQCMNNNGGGYNSHTPSSPSDSPTNSGVDMKISGPSFLKKIATKLSTSSTDVNAGNASFGDEMIQPRSCASSSSANSAANNSNPSGSPLSSPLGTTAPTGRTSSNSIVTGEGSHGDILANQNSQRRPSDASVSSSSVANVNDGSKKKSRSNTLSKFWKPKLRKSSTQSSSTNSVATKTPSNRFSNLKPLPLSSAETLSAESLTYLDELHALNPSRNQFVFELREIFSSFLKATAVKEVAGSAENVGVLNGLSNGAFQASNNNGGSVGLNNNSSAGAGSRV